MKQPENNEIDSLLRSWASRERPASAGSAVNVTGAHLDADELNSYAEGALPPTTRARYTSHLADCDDCRKIVAQLSLAAGPVISEAAVGHSSATFNWRKLLAALLAPAVLRYAMPALVLVIIGFTFFATRQQRLTSKGALDASSSRVSPTTQSGGEATKEQASATRPFADAGKNGAPSATQAPNATKTAEERQKSTDTAKPNSSPNSSEKETPRDEVAALAQPTYPPEPAPPPAVAKPAPASETKDSSRVASGVAETRPAAPRKREADKQDDNKRGDKQTEKESNEANASASGAAAEDASAKGRDDDGKKAKTEKSPRRGAFGSVDQGETRSVGGRHFQRRNGIWVDTAFNSSLSVTPVSRGSEQYRALVADEPGIDTIAKQLSGEIFLVWKGRGYRIH
jgi:hypothetical protein